MNWHLSHLCLAVLFWVAAVCFSCLVFLFVFLLVLFVSGSCCCFWFFDDVVTRLDYVQVLHQITLEAPQSAGGHVCIN